MRAKKKSLSEINDLRRAGFKVRIVDRRSRRTKLLEKQIYKWRREVTWLKREMKTLEEKIQALDWDIEREKGISQNLRGKLVVYDNIANAVSTLAREKYGDHRVSQVNKQEAGSGK